MRISSVFAIYERVIRIPIQFENVVIGGEDAFERCVQGHFFLL
jgi:hypothetical protein